jgi:hypothetical protein
MEKLLSNVIFEKINVFQVQIKLIFQDGIIITIIKKHTIGHITGADPLETFCWRKIGITLSEQF